MPAYTIELDNGVKLHVHLDNKPVELTFEFTDGKKVDFKYDPSEAPSTITFDDEAPRTVSKRGSKYVNQVGSAGRWVKYESTNIEGTKHS